MAISMQELLAQAAIMINKGVISTSALSSGGLLNPEQSNKFIDLVIDETAMRGHVRIIRVKAGELQIDKIGVGRRVTVPKEEAIDPGIRRGVATSKIKLNPEDVMVPFEISDNFELENIEGESIQDTIVRMMATQFANDLEEMYLRANRLGAAVLQSDIIDGGSATQYVKDGLMALQDGWFTLAMAGNIVDALGANVSAQLFSDMINAMPTRFKKNRKNLRLFTPPTIEQNYRMQQSTRATAIGDTALNGMPDLTPFSIRMLPVNLLSETPLITEHITLTGTDVIPLLNKNLVDGGEVVVEQTIDSTPVTPYIEGTDYNMDYVNGTIVRDAGGSLTDPHDVKISYEASAQILLTNSKNLIVGIGRDIRIERNRDIFKGVNQFAMTGRVSTQIEDVNATVLAINVGRE